MQTTVESTVVENVVVMDFTKSQIRVVNEPQKVYQFPVEIGNMLLSLYKESVYHGSFESIRRGLISDIREQNNMTDLNKMLFEFMEKREFIDNVVNNNLDTYKTENFVEEKIIVGVIEEEADLPALAIPTGNDDEDYQPKKVGTIKNLDKYNRE